MIIRSLASKAYETPQEINLPHSSTLERLSVNTSSRPDLSDYAISKLGPTPSTMSHIANEFIHYLKRSPLLSSICFPYLPSSAAFPSIENTGFIEPDYFVPSNQWIETGHRGIIIREYQGSGIEQTLWHIRSLSRCVPGMGEVELHIGLARCWRD